MRIGQHVRKMTFLKKINLEKMAQKPYDKNDLNLTGIVDLGVM